MTTPLKSYDDVDRCCCGHAPRLHLYGVGACTVCRRSCEKFHNVGEGHGLLAHAAFFIFIAIVAVAIGAGAWAFWLVVRGRITFGF